MNACATLCRSPNIVLVVLDGASRVPGGMRAAHGPDVERLAARGLRYTSYHPEAPARLAKASACLPELLRSRGYAIVTAGDRQSYADGNPSGTAGTARDAGASPASFIDAIRVLESCASGAPACPLFFRFFKAAPAERAAFLIGRILTSLERAGALEDTLFVLIPMRPAASSCSDDDALCCGYDCGLLGLPEYRPRFRFTGVIKQVVVDVSEDPYQPGGFGEPARRLQ